MRQFLRRNRHDANRRRFRDVKLYLKARPSAQAATDVYYNKPLSKPLWPRENPFADGLT
jgi:hypothetical protein